MQYIVSIFFYIVIIHNFVTACISPTESVYRQEMLTKKGFLAEIRKAIRLCKNRHYKDVSIRKRSKNSFLNDDHSNSSSDDENDPPNPNEKVTNTPKNCGRDENKNSCSNEKHITLDFNEF